MRAEKVISILDEVDEMGVAGADKDVVLKLIDDNVADLTDDERQALEIGLQAASHYMMGRRLRGWWYRRKFFKAIGRGDNNDR